MGPIRIGIGIAIAIGCRIVEKPSSDIDPDSDVLWLRLCRAKILRPICGLWFEAFDHSIHVLALLEQLYPDEACLGQTSLDFLIGIAAAS